MAVLRGLFLGLVVLLVLYALLTIVPPFSVGVGGGMAVGGDSVLNGQVVIQKVVIPDKPSATNDL